MRVHFFDSSAIAKRYVNEAGTAWILGLVGPTSGNHNYLASITAVEVVSALTRQQRSGSLSGADAAAALAAFRHDFANEYRILDISAAMIDVAMDMAEKHALRGYDAVQLAAALRVHSQSLASGMTLTLVSADLALNAAAVAEGLAVEDPNAHP